MEYLRIEAVREGYAPSQCPSTLTVGELIDLLEEFDESTPVYLSHDEGYTYGAVRASRVDLAYCDED